MEPWTGICASVWSFFKFQPFRAIGFITAGGVPFSVPRLGTETFVTVSVGKTFHVYNRAKLNLVLAGKLVVGFELLHPTRNILLLYVEVICRFQTNSSGGYLE